MGFYIGTGLGFAMMVGGRLITGERGFAGEGIGHIPLKGKSDQCNCGNTGCLNSIPPAGPLRDNGGAGAMFPTSSVNPTHAGDVKSGWKISTLGMVTAITIMDPTLVIVGGGVTNMQGFPYEKLEEQVRACLRHQLLVAETLQIQRSTAGPHGGCIGAARYCFLMF